MDIIFSDEFKKEYKKIKDKQTRLKIIKQLRKSLKIHRPANRYNTNSRTIEAYASNHTGSSMRYKKTTYSLIALITEIVCMKYPLDILVRSIHKASCLSRTHGHTSESQVVVRRRPV